MIKIVGVEFIPRLGNGRPENGTAIALILGIISDESALCEAGIKFVMAKRQSHAREAFLSNG